MLMINLKHLQLLDYIMRNSALLMDNFIFAQKLEASKNDVF